MVVTRRSFLVMFHFETILDCANRLNLSSESNVSTLVRDFPVRVNLNSHIGEAIYDYCIMAGIGGGQHGPSVVELMSLLKFVVHTGPFEAIYLARDRAYYDHILSRGIDVSLPVIRIPDALKSNEDLYDEETETEDS